MGKTNKSSTTIIPVDDLKLPESLITPESTDIELKNLIEEVETKPSSDELLKQIEEDKQEEMLIESEEEITAQELILAAISKIEEQLDSTNKHKNISQLKEVLERL